jgi:uncharacterized delta-60 repeat protein
MEQQFNLLWKHQISDTDYDISTFYNPAQRNSDGSLFFFESRKRDNLYNDIYLLEISSKGERVSQIYVFSEHIIYGSIEIHKASGFQKIGNSINSIRQYVDNDYIYIYGDSNETIVFDREGIFIAKVPFTGSNITSNEGHFFLQYSNEYWIAGPNLNYPPLKNVSNTNDALIIKISKDLDDLLEYQNSIWYYGTEPLPWVSGYRSSSYDFAYDHELDEDNSIYLIGATGISSDRSGFLQKILPDGSIGWFSGLQQTYSNLQLHSNYIYLIGGTGSPAGLRNSALSKMTKDGNIVWSKELHGNTIENFTVGEDGSIYTISKLASYDTQGTFFLTPIISRFDDQGNSGWTLLTPLNGDLYSQIHSFSIDQTPEYDSALFTVSLTLRDGQGLSFSRSEFQIQHYDLIISTGGDFREGGHVSADLLSASNLPANINISYKWQKLSQLIYYGQSFQRWENLEGADGMHFQIPDDQSWVDSVIRAQATLQNDDGTYTVFASAGQEISNVDDEATGTLTVTGTAEEGGALTSRLSNLSDIDGYTNTFFKLEVLSTDGERWLDTSYSFTTVGSNWSYLNGGTTEATLFIGSAYQDPQSGQVLSVVGRQIRVVATSIDTLGGTTTFVGPALTIANVNDAPRGFVKISGTPTQGQTLIASNNLSDPDRIGDISYTWYAGLTAIGTDSTYKLTQAEVGKKVTVTASYTDGGNTKESVSSAPTDTVANVNDAPMGSVTILGMPTQGQTLTASQDLSDADGLGDITYTWYAGATTLGTGSTHKLTQSAVGMPVTVIARYTDGGNTIESVSSAASDTVENVNDTPTGSVTISGTPTRGQTLSVSNTLADADGLRTITYTWYAGTLTLGTGSTLKLTQAAVGKSLYVTASYTDGGNTIESVSSAATVIVNAPPVMVPVGRSDTAYSSFLQPDGQIVLAGYSTNIEKRSAFGVIRLHSNGSLDTSFGENGKLILPVGVNNDSARSSFFQPDGKIVLVGSSSNGSNVDFSIVRLNSNGTLDTSFGENGKLLIPIRAGDDYAYSTFLQPDGKIVLAGSSSNGSNSDFSIVRLNSNGSLDTSFGENGKLLIPVGINNESIFSTFLQPDGRIVLAGSSFNGPDSLFSVIRINSNGSLDTGFGEGGKLLLRVGLNNDYASSAFLQPDGKIVLVGSSSNGSNVDFSIVRLNSNGTLDTSFGENGKLLIPVRAGDDYASSTFLQPDGKIVLAGTSSNGSNNDFSIVRLNSNGNLDTSFGENGKLLLPVGIGHDYARSTFMQPDGKIVLVGSSWIGNFSDYSYNDDFSIVRLNSDGSLDQTFGSSQLISNSMPTGSVTITGTPKQGHTLTAANSLADADGWGAITYTWQADGASVGAGTTYALTQAEVGKTITVTASYTDGSDNAESVTSAATATVANVDDEATGTLSVSGNSIIGSLLTATITEMVDADGLVTSIAWQWQRGITPESGSALIWADIPGATDTNFSIPVGSDQLGVAMRVVVTTGDAAGGTSVLISPPTAEVEGLQATIAAQFWSDAAPLANVLIEADTGAMYAETELDGVGTLDGISGTSLTMSAQKTITTQDGPAASQAVTLQDAVAILKMISGQAGAAASPTAARAQSLAADFDGSGTVSLADALGVLRHAVGLQAPKPSWVFVEEGDDALPSLLNPGIPGPVTVEVTPPGPIEVNLIGVLRGDVDGSYGVYSV